MEDCEGPTADVPVDIVSTMEEDGTAGKSNGEALCSTRAELMERLKRGESPQWIPNQSVGGKMEQAGVSAFLQLSSLLCPARDGTSHSTL